MNGISLKATATAGSVVRLAVLASDFDPRSYGQSKLIDLVKKTGAFEVRRNETGIVHDSRKTDCRKVNFRKNAFSLASRPVI
jgi:hypothetical protein